MIFLYLRVLIYPNSGIMKRILPFIFLFFILITSNAQPSIGGTPNSFAFSSLTTNIDSRYVAKPDMDLLAYLDDMDTKSGHPYRIASNIPVSMNMQNSGTWTDLPDQSGRIWRLNITSPDAHALIVYYDQFYLPPGAKLFLYDESRKQILGAYTENNNPESGNFANEMIEGENLTLEYFEPTGTIGNAIISIEEIGYVYRGETTVNPDLPLYKSSGSCEVNINCTEGANWQDEKKGVCKLLTKIGTSTYMCSGSLVNNTSGVCTPYVLTADHCSYDDVAGYATVANMNQWVFYFHYEATSCSGTSASGTKTKIGCSLKAHDTYGSIGSGSDFYLVQLNNAIPSSDGLYYNGWSRSATASTSGVSIHHPAGDIMKISTYTSTLISVYVGAPGSHWQVTWAATTNGHGVTEGGSSGSPLFNSTGLLIGTLTGGTSYCTALTDPDYYGKFSYHWASNGSTSATQLKPWLDPGNTGVTTLNGTFTCTPSSVEEEALMNAAVNVFPNPASYSLHVSLGEYTLNKPVMKLYSQIGQLVYVDEFDGKIQGELVIDVQKQPSGLYFLSLESDNVRINKKIIIEH
jgi:hypothetical protein